MDEFERWLDFEFLGNPVQRWLIALGIALAVALVLRVVVGIVLGRLQKLTHKTKTGVDDAIVDSLKSTRAFFYILMGLYCGSLALAIPESAGRILNICAKLVLLIQFGFWVSRAVGSVVRDIREADEDSGRKTTATAVGFMARIAVWTLVVLLALANMGVEISALVAGLGIGGVAAALAIQNVLGDLIASLSIYFDRPFDLGDFIIVGSEMGTVQKVGMRTTRVAGLGGEQIILANADLERARVRNFKRMQERRIVFRVGIEYNLPFDKVAKTAGLLKEIVESVDGVRFDRAHFAGYGDSALEHEIVYYVESPDYNVYMDRQHEINLEIYRRFEQEGLGFAFPTRTVHLIAEEPQPMGEAREPGATSAASSAASTSAPEGGAGSAQQSSKAGEGQEK